MKRKKCLGRLTKKWPNVYLIWTDWLTESWDKKLVFTIYYANNYVCLIILSTFSPIDHEASFNETFKSSHTLSDLVRINLFYFNILTAPKNYHYHDNNRLLGKMAPKLWDHIILFRQRKGWKVVSPMNEMMMACTEFWAKRRALESKVSISIINSNCFHHPLCLMLSASKRRDHHFFLPIPTSIYFYRQTLPISTQNYNLLLQGVPKPFFSYF